MQPAEGPEPPDGYGNDPRQARHDSSIQQDLAARHRADGGILFSLPVLIAAPTEPKVTDVTAASTSAVFIGNDECIPTGMLGQPLLRIVVEDHLERFRHPESPGRRA